MSEVPLHRLCFRRGVTTPECRGGWLDDAYNHGSLLRISNHHEFLQMQIFFTVCFRWTNPFQNSGLVGIQAGG